MFVNGVTMTRLFLAAALSGLATLAAAQTPPPAAPAEGVSFDAWAARARERLMALDTDHDGKITAAEAEKLRNDSFDKADANHDGTLTPEEIEAARAAAMAAHQPK